MRSCLRSSGRRRGGRCPAGALRARVLHAGAGGRALRRRARAPLSSPGSSGAPSPARRRGSRSTARRAARRRPRRRGRPRQIALGDPRRLQRHDDERVVSALAVLRWIAYHLAALDLALWVLPVRRADRARRERAASRSGAPRVLAPRRSRSSSSLTVEVAALRFDLVAPNRRAQPLLRRAAPPHRCSSPGSSEDSRVPRARVVAAAGVAARFPAPCRSCSS